MKWTSLLYLKTSVNMPYVEICVEIHQIIRYVPSRRCIIFSVVDSNKTVILIVVF